MRELLRGAELPSGVKPWHKEIHNTLAESLGWAGCDRPLELLPCNLSHQDQHITEEEMRREASKDKVTVSASSKSRTGNNTPFCPNSIIIPINFILWELLGHCWEKKIMMIKRQQLLGYKMEIIWNKIFRKIQGNYKFNHKWNRSLGRTDHTSDTIINVKEKPARREFLDEWLPWYSFQAGEVTGCSENQSLFWLHNHECSSAGPWMSPDHQRLQGLWMKDFCYTPSMTAPIVYQDLWCLTEQCEVRVKSNFCVHSCEYTTEINHPATVNLQ